MRTDELIVELARAAGPIRPLPRPSVRLAQWTAAVVPLTAVCVIVIGPRRDVLHAIQQLTFVGIAAATLATAVLSAAAAFVLSVPAGERSPLQRVVPLVALGVWVLVLAVMLTTEGDSARRLMALPFHWLCLIEIAGLGLVPGWALFAMLRRAAPLRRSWSGAFGDARGRRGRRRRHAVSVSDRRSGSPSRGTRPAGRLACGRRRGRRTPNTRLATKDRLCCSIAVSG